MSIKPLGIDVAREARALAMGPVIAYKELVCDRLVYKCVNACGGGMKYSGTNDMVRNGMDLVWKLEGSYLDSLKPGNLLFIKEPDESGLPAKYRGDGIGDYSHVGIYIGDALAFEDADKNGKKRLCNVVHSSSTMQRVCGSRLDARTVSGGWGYGAWALDIDNDGAAAELPPEGQGHPEFAEPPAEEGQDYPVPAPAEPAIREPGFGEAIIATQETGLILRREPKAKAASIKEMPKGAIVKVLEQYGNDWTKVEFVDFRGRLHRGWCATKYVRLG